MPEPVKDVAAERRDYDRMVAIRLSECEQYEAEVCAHVGHEWGDAGGGLQVCVVCTAERWDPDA